jgi:hypothetical protein
VASDDDKIARSMWPTVAVAAVVLLFAAGLPLVDTLLRPRTRVVAAGTQVALVAQASGAGAVAPAAPQTVRFVPAAGWERDGSDEPEGASATVTKGGVAFEIRAQPASSSDDCDAALATAEAELQNSDSSGRLHDAQSFSTDGGQVGVTAPFVGARVEGLVFAVCTPELIGVAVGSGAIGALQGNATEPVIAMARSMQVGT